MNEIEKILIIQKMDCEIRDMEKELNDIPARKQHEQERLAEDKKNQANAEDRMKGCLAELKKIELEVEARNEQIEKLRKQQFEIKTNKEYQAIEHEIKAIGSQIAGLEDEELAVMERMDTVKGEIALGKQAVREKESAIDSDLKVLDERAASLQQRVDEVKSVRSGKAAEVDALWLRSYEIIFQNKKGVALVSSEHGICGGCHMKLPPAVVHDASRHTLLVACNYCGRLLY